MNSNIYDPERWIEADEEREGEMFGSLELIFGVGKYGCLGKTLAYLEAEKVLFEMIRRFDSMVLVLLHPVSSTNMMFFAQ